MFKVASSSAGFSNFNMKPGNQTITSNFSNLNNPPFNHRSIDPGSVDEVIDETDLQGAAADFEA